MDSHKSIFPHFLLVLALFLFTAGALAQTDRGPHLVRPATGEYAGQLFYTNSFALIIGINRYPNMKDSNLHYAVQDAKDLRDMLIKSYGFPAENVTLLLDGDATKKDIEDALGDLADGTRVKETDRVLVFFAGHGKTVKLANGDAMGFLLPADADADLAHPENRSGYLNTSIDMKSLWTKLEACTARHRLLIADACFAGLLAHVRAIGDGKLNSREIQKQLATSAMQVITGGSADETTQEKDEWGHGAFTKELLDRLRIHAAAEDDLFMASELGAELKRAVGNLTDGKQSPQIANHGDTDGDFLFLTTKPRSVYPYHAGLLPPQPDSRPNRINAKDGAQMVYVPGGEFKMGDRDQPDNLPHKVTLAGYFIYKNLVTVAQYKTFCSETGRSMPPTPNWGWKDNHPIVSVSWDNANAYCKWASVRLPTEAEWEKAARGTDGRKYPWGDTFDPGKLWCSNSMHHDADGTAPVGRYTDSPYGVSDMAGNVWQWCADWFDAQHDTRLMRGGSWGDFDSHFFRASWRSRINPDGWYTVDGFRCAADR